MSTTNPTDFNKRLGRAVRDRRIKLGLSQETVGRHLGVTFQQHQKYERGINRISVEALVTLAKALDTTSQALINAATAEDTSGNQTEAAPIKQARIRLEIERRVAGLSVTRQHIVRNVIKALAEEEAA